MTGIILYNGFWNEKKIPDPALRLEEAAKSHGLILKPRPNTAFSACLGDSVSVSGLEPGQLVLCWDKDVRLIRAMEAAGAHVYNCPDAVAVCDDKSATHLALSGKNIPMPKTMVAPMTYVSYGLAGNRFLEEAADKIGFPMVFKECFGSLGEQVYYIENKAKLEEKASQMKHRPFLLQEYIAESAGRDKRLYVVGNRVVAAMRRESKTDFRANIGSGGTGYAYTPTSDEVELAIQCCTILHLDFAGVDLLDSNRGTLVCEVNASAHMAEITRCTGVDVADEIVKYVLKREGLSC